MTENTDEEKLQQKVDDITSKEEPKKVSATSLIDEARKLKEENTKLVAEMKEERLRLEEIRANDMLAGQSVVAPKKSQETTDEEEAKKIIQMFR